MGLEGYRVLQAFDDNCSILSFTVPRPLTDRNLEIINGGCFFGKTKNKINKQNKPKEQHLITITFKQNKLIFYSICAQLLFIVIFFKKRAL